MVNETRNNGGAAFPTHPYEVRDADGNLIERSYGEAGMSLRDWFAGQALACLGAAIPYVVGLRGATPEQMPKMLAAGAYEIADAMLFEARKR
jgi:hypothetical protein